MVICKKIYFEVYTNNQYIWHKNNIAQLCFILKTAELHWNFSSWLRMPLKFVKGRIFWTCCTVVQREQPGPSTSLSLWTDRQTDRHTHAHRRLNVTFATPLVIRSKTNLSEIAKIMGQLCVKSRMMYEHKDWANLRTFHKIQKPWIPKRILKPS